MSMSLRNLQYFVAVAKQGSFSKAANNLFITQPSLSRQISDLEKTLGATLFIRSAKGVELTPEGQYLLDHVENVFTLMGQIPDGISAAKTEKRTVRIGIPQGIPNNWSISTFAQLQEEIPRISISLYEASTEEQRLMLQNGLLDFGLLHTEPAELQSQLLFYQPLGVAISPLSSIQDKSQIFFTDLDNLRVMCHSDGEIAQNEARWRLAAEEASVNIHWVFRKFSQHSELIAHISEVDAVLITQASAEQNMPNWSWLPLENKETLDIDNQIGTWLAWTDGTKYRFPEVKTFFIKDRV